VHDEVFEGPNTHRLDVWIMATYWFSSPTYPKHVGAV